ncbi:MAG: hypothetical protein JXA33_21155 [Anaerolineae bacterium]|nr:hypothetical protein [Anaerolineae bacterium]
MQTSVGECYQYGYDEVGNRTVLTVTESFSDTAVTTYTYDTANRLTAVDNAAYTYDQRGNLTSDGVYTYTYDGAGRMVQVATPFATLVYTYNADGLRVAQNQGGVYQAFVWDWTTGVPELLSDGDQVYLVGHDTLGWYANGEWTFVLPDALGSVRQTADISGTVTGNREWSPFGVEDGSTQTGGQQTGLGYTGEWQDAYSALVYLRARWYDSGMGRFTTSDSIAPDFQNPSSSHRYIYSENNVVNLTDPSGLTPYLQYPNNPYDLTNWLYQELAFNSNSYYVRRIRELGLGGHFNLGKEAVDSARAFAAFYFLVRDKAKWDFKHKINNELGQKVALLNGEELHWYEYSVTGNVHYGFVGRAAGFTAFELYAGAGYAEIKDPAHIKRGEACCPEACLVAAIEDVNLYEGCIKLGCYYINPDWTKSFFDDPQDQASVEFGIQMYNAYGKALTEVQFRDYLTCYGDELTPALIVYGPGIPQAEWPYYIGYFNGPDDAQNERWLQLLLASWW